jgi:hypothetical protein
MLPVCAFAQSTRGVVVDQTGLPLPGVQLELRRGGELVTTTMTAGDGTFEVPATSTDVVRAQLDGFETTDVPVAKAQRIVLPLARATEHTEVVASALTSSGAAMETLGSTMTPTLAQRLPETRPRILQSLPLLPSVVRGADGQLRIGGTRPHESSLWIDGFDVTDPVTLTSAIDLPNESVKGMAVLREPTAATFSGVLGSLASIETLPGGDRFSGGVQGFIPRPRLSNLGLGKIEAFFPRAYASGRVGALHYFGSTEFNFERVPVPGVTDRSGNPSTGATGTSSFGRFDIQLTPNNTLSFDVLFAPATTTLAGLSPLIEPSAAPDIESRDFFGGVIDRIVVNSTNLLTIRVGVGEHKTSVAASGSGAAIFAPDGWHQNWFAAVDDSGRRQTGSITWDRSDIRAAGLHTLSASADIRGRSMTGSIAHEPVEIRDEEGRLVRLIQTEQIPSLSADDQTGGFGVRDLWQVHPRVQIDTNIRADFSSISGSRIAPRLAASYSIDAEGKTVLKGAVGRFVGRVPLGAFTFGQLGSRMDTSYNPVTGAVIQQLTKSPALAPLTLPYSDAVSVEIEHHLRHGIELQAAARRRDGAALPTVMVPPAGGPVFLASYGSSTYREFQVSVRKTWRADREMFVSYVRSTAKGNVNDYGTLVTNLDTPLFEPAGMAPMPTDTPHRLRAWATFQLPEEIVVSPAVDWRTGFPYSIVDVRRHYVGTPDSERFPQYFSLDVTAFRTFTILGRKMDLGLQFFNVTAHFNPRDVIAVADTSQFQTFTNSFGFTLGGYFRVRW